MQIDTREIVLIAAVCVLAAFVAGAVIGFNHVTSTDTESVSVEADVAPHTHDGREVTAPYPTLSMDIFPDSRMGWNIQLETDNFRFAPERVNQAYRVGEGHAHLYVNGERITRLYGHWYHLTDLSSGEHVVTVSLSGNDHSELMVNGVPIQVSQTITVE